MTAAPVATLSPRQAEVYALARSGLRTKDIADRLHRSYHTITVHRKVIGRKLGRAWLKQRTDN